LDKGFHTDSRTCESWFLLPKGTKHVSGMLGGDIGIGNPFTWGAWGSGLGAFIYPAYIQDNKAFAKHPVFQ